MSPPPPTGDQLKFLGTAGARHVVATQVRHSGGLVYTAGGLRIWVDPGPGALVRALASRPRVDPARIDALVITHRHLDHAGDATAVVEAMTGGGFEARGTLLAPAEALDEEPVVFRYAHRFLARIEALRAGGTYALGPGVSLATPIAHDHGVETYGYRLSWGGFTVGHVVDTFWMDDLPRAYAGVDLLIVNTTRLRGGDRRLLHLGADDAERLVAAVRPRLAVLTHLGMQLVRTGPEEVALSISERTGVPTIAARDGQALPLPPPPDVAQRRARPARRRPSTRAGGRA
jgi:phosphoribosyl 1,2-cyclic phosphodiesterase